MLPATCSSYCPSSAACSPSLCVLHHHTAVLSKSKGVVILLEVLSCTMLHTRAAAHNHQHIPAACRSLLAAVRQLHYTASAAQSTAQPGPGEQRSEGLPHARSDQAPAGVPYPTHVPLNPLQKGAVAGLSALGALLRPARGDWVGLVGETFGDAAVRAMAQRMRDSPTGRQILAERPRVTDAAVAHCWDLPSHTFGGAYAQFMGARGFRADDRPVVRVVDDEQLAYVITRAREVHDFWHVLTGCHTNVFGELALKALEFVQTGLPMAGMAVAGAQFKLSAADRQLLWQAYLPWAAQTGLRCADLMCIYYEQHFEEDLQELRARWRITPAPPVPEHLAAKGRAAQHAGSGTNAVQDEAAQQLGGSQGQQQQQHQANSSHI